MVEDDSDLRTPTAFMVAQLGYTVFEASDAASAPQMLRQSLPVALLLCDVTLPGGVSGPELAEAVRRESPQTEALFVSGYAKNVSFDGVPLAHSPLLLTKPFRMHELAKAMRAAIEHQSP